MSSVQPARIELERTEYSSLVLLRILRALSRLRRSMWIGHAVRGLVSRTALQRRSRPRLALSAVVVGIAAAIAVWVATYRSPNGEMLAGSHWSLSVVRAHWSYFFTSPAWVIPSALGIGVLGLAAAAITLRLRLTAAVLTLGAGLAGAIALHAYLIAPRIPTVMPGGLSPTLARPAWVAPTALGIVLLALATAASMLVGIRRTSP